MEKRLAIWIGLIAMLVFGSLAPAMQDSKNSKEQCVACHSFEKLVKAPATFKEAEGEAVNPHRYIPHDTEDVPKCSECHFVQHEIPLKDKASVVKPKDVSYCYDSCHHAKNLQPCKNCH